MDLRLLVLKLNSSVACFLFSQYVGIIEDVPVDIDTTNRTTVLRIIDEGKVTLDTVIILLHDEENEDYFIEKFFSGL